MQRQILMGNQQRLHTAAARLLLGLCLTLAGCARTTIADIKPAGSPAASRIPVFRPEEPIAGHEYQVVGLVKLDGKSGGYTCRSPEQLANAAAAKYPSVDAIVDYRNLPDGCEGVAVEYLKVAR